MTEIQELPEGCIAAILSRTTPVDAGRFSLISKTFRSAADSDAVWSQFLPSDPNFTASVVSQSPSLANAPTKKALYLALSDHPIIIDNGHKSVQLDRKSGKFRYMLAARSLTIIWSDHDQYWDWIELPDSRFPEVAELLDVCWFDIHGTINTIALSPNTEYVTYLVFKMVDAHGFQNRPIELSVFVEGGHSSTKNVCLDPDVEGRYHNRVVGLQCPNVRSDGWLEIEMGEFFNSGIENEEVQMKVLETGGNWKRGLFVEGIEVRPK
ncbi:F-box protein PP2-B10-like [Vicia villosa]|uniref:F-box protein PP2-B10-like n=1 Tax=Vicia villosa TaxID=3911 RepID=UPI00273ACD6D|nr:F-box protein PP2-B10-like [Vicia villosa]